ncbi:sensor histidine kinase ResE [Clostridium aceticum]|uniref:Stage 0 sporulation protein A homolog n=1 Tax=Clostridium aceticum TaxID=84022 RepID=A0A0D8IBU1_9CLOT|nr:hybrid sensor histidine kinase/response regulator [Clostridium aceticum]AKL96813.1 sensor histidine kinase ResE [Clostridium aceticum]KJF27564.1 histidine kinase [Clostridium aceticum]
MKKCASYTILIVDDNENNLFTLRSLIEEYIDATVIEASCGVKALQELSRNHVDLIILDIQMEEMDGFEIASLIKQRKRTKDIPIVFLTASYIGEECRKRGFEVGGVDYLTKPIDEYQLVNRINVYLKLIEKERSMNMILEEKVNEQTKELRKAKEDAEIANQTKTAFLANVSHEFKTPLNIIMGTIQMLRLYLEKDEALDRKKVKKKIDMQLQNCYRLLRLVNNLIDITKIDSGDFEVFKNKCNIVEIVKVITLSVADYIENKGILLSFDTDVEEKIIQCDLDAMERILLNLLSNAIKFTPTGGRISVSLKSLEERIEISVEDTGSGIPEDQLELIFERFKQTDELLTRRQEGSGIGLSLVKSLVAMQGGRIYVESLYKKGSKFTIQLPVQLEGGKNTEEKVLGYESSKGVIDKIQVEFSDIYSLDLTS